MASDDDNGMFDDVKGVRSDFKLEYFLKYKFNISKSSPYNRPPRA
jgi:hypothetical protein